jgi:hypothetical protein
MLRRIVIGCFVLAAMCLVSVSRAKADGTDAFTFTTGTTTYTWDLASSPVISGSYPLVDFEVENVAYAINGVGQGAASLDFYTYGAGGGFDLGTDSEGLLVDQYGLATFSGWLTSPTFILGTYKLTDSFGIPDGTLKISAVNAPEPSSLLLTSMGLIGLLGLASRKKLFSNHSLAIAQVQTAAA